MVDVLVFTVAQGGHEAVSTVVPDTDGQCYRRVPSHLCQPGTSPGHWGGHGHGHLHSHQPAWLWYVKYVVEQSQDEVTHYNPNC